jgi:hypothetical protein
MSEKNIAIVAVHGVGDHEPHSSARAISRLLLRIPRAYGGRYTSFSESPIGIPTAPVPEAASEQQVIERKSRELQSRTRRSLYDERPERGSGDIPEAVAAHGSPPPDVRFMRDQLRDYESNPSDAVYESVRIEGRHIEPDAADGTESSTADARIHVYEMYWSDISRVGKSFLSIFGTFYQVVIHLPYVGLITLEESRGRHERSEGPASGSAQTKPFAQSRFWDSWLASYRWAMRCMTLVAPTLNILMLAVGLGALTMLIPASAQRMVALIVPALVTFIVATWFIYHRRTGRWYIDVAIPLASAGLVFGGAWMIDGPVHPAAALMFEWWALTLVPLYFIFAAFNRVRPFASRLAGMIWVLISVAMVFLAATSGQSVTVTVVGTLEILNLVLLLTWFVYALSTAAVTAFGLVVPRVGPAERKDRTLRAAYTARFALAMPGVAFAIVTLTIWGALVAAEGGKTFAKTGAYQPLFNYPALEKHKERDRATAGVRDSITLAHRGLRDSAVVARRQAVADVDGAAYFLRAFGGSSDGFAGLVGAILIAGAFVALVWVLIPVLVTEIASPHLDIEARQGFGFSERARALGTWLSTAFRAARISGEVLVLSVILSMAGIIIGVPIPMPDWVVSLTGKVPTLDFSYLQIGNWVLGVGAVGLYAVFTRLSIVGSRLRPVFGIMADVDNYLRELPRNRTPRAQMAERYTSLLRYLCRWRADGVQEKSYDAIILVAHSQGTVITADLLRYLKHYGAGERHFEPHLAPLAANAAARAKTKPIPVYLVTMGSPLRQLYGQRFPDIYQWVGGSSDANAAAPASPDASHLLGVAGWINLYRSGDYVGRSLWRTPDNVITNYDPRVREVSSAERRGEACIGAGAHTHYWDESAESVALALDSMVRGIISQQPSSELVEETVAASVAPPGPPPSSGRNAWMSLSRVRGAREIAPNEVRGPAKV